MANFKLSTDPAPFSQNVSIADVLANRPASANLGDQYWATDTNAVYRWNGAAWVAAGLVTAGNSSVQYGPTSSVPAAGTAAGYQYVCTDSPYTFISNGTIMQPFAYGSLVNLPPLVSSLNWINQGTGTATNLGGTSGIFMTDVAHAGDNLRCLFKSVYPTTPYTFTVGLEYNWPTVNYFTSGIVVSDGTKYAVFGALYSTGVLMWYGAYSSLTSNASSTTVSTAGWGGIVYLTFKDDGNNFYFWASPSPYDLQRTQIYTGSRTAYLSNPTKVGIYFDINNATYPSSALFFHWTGI